MHRDIDLGEEGSVSGQEGMYVLLNIPDRVYAAEDWQYDAILLDWINSMSRVGLQYHGLDYRGSAVFRIGD